MIYALWWEIRVKNGDNKVDDRWWGKYPNYVIGEELQGVKGLTALCLAENRIDLIMSEVLKHPAPTYK